MTLTLSRWSSMYNSTSDRADVPFVWASAVEGSIGQDTAEPVWCGCWASLMVDPGQW
ncbi:hypothetical protein V3N99_01150 [Dermatophilaceae bacterium Soc4.6]